MDPLAGVGGDNHENVISNNKNNNNMNEKFDNVLPLERWYKNRNPPCLPGWWDGAETRDSQKNAGKVDLSLDGRESPLRFSTPACLCLIDRTAHGIHSSFQ